ncbi:MAG: hypothetical protein V7K71_15825 [Nostoc sp.]|uniref:HEAT repeat domain-containing protein n=1 Tax=Nostoc sp. TaxID=1180 RepID=UPI002FF8CD60
MDDTILPLTKNVTQAQLAAEPSTDAELLRELALSTDQQTRQSVAGNPNTPVDVLLRLGAEFPSQLLDNPVFPLLLLENLNLVAEIPLPTLRSILKQENVPVYILEQVADRADLEVQLGLVKNVQTPKGVLNRLTQSRHPQVVESARLHINLAGELTEKYEERIQEVIQGIIPDAYRARNGTVFLAVLAQICPIPEFIVEHWVQDSSYQDSVCRRLASSPATFPSILKHLANHTDDWTRCEVAENPNTPVETLRKFATEEQACFSLALNLSTPADILESLSTNQNQTIRIKVAQHPNTPLNVVKDLANDTDMDVANAAARVIGEYTAEAVRKDPKTPTHVLEKLAQTDPTTVCEHPNATPELLLEFSKSISWSVRQNVARNSNTPVSILEELAHDESWEVRCGVAKNPNVPVSILKELAQDDSSEVRCQVSRNPNTPISLLFKQLARDASGSRAIAYQMSSKKYGEYPEFESILDILAEESTSPLETILQRLAQDGGEAARLFLARRFDLPINFLTQFAESTEVKVCEVVAQNLNTPVSCLEKLAQSAETKVREAVAQNPNTPISILEQLGKDKNYDVLLHIAQKTNLSPEILEELAGSKYSDKVREKAMLNPSLPKEVVERILCGEYATHYLKLNPDFLSRHPDSLAVTLNHYAKSQFPLVSFIALNQPQISQELLQEKSLSISWLERLAVAQNPQATQQILTQLAQDSNQLVRAAAKNRLQNLSQS